MQQNKPEILLDGQLVVFGRELIDQAAIDQIMRCIGPDDKAVLTADAHKGYGHPVGGCVAYADHVSIAGVGYDIACGNKAVQTNIRVSDLKPGDITALADNIARNIGFGMGTASRSKIVKDHPVFDAIDQSPVDGQRKLLDLARGQLGTVGGGNHFVDVFAGDDGYVWIGVHFGSRGFGHKTASGFLALAAGQKFEDRVGEGSMDKAPVLINIHTSLGQDYLAAMNIGGQYAYAGRDRVVEQVLGMLGAEATFTVHNHHNFAWEEMHDGRVYHVVRKGCTPAFAGQYGFIGSNMFDESVIITGQETENSRLGLRSTVHGAGRVLSRTQAAGKQKWMRDEVTGKKRPVTVAPGLVDFDAVKARAKKLLIELRGAGADEAPQCYKPLQDVLDASGDTIKVENRLQPLVVVMAGAGDEDPYKD